MNLSGIKVLAAMLTLFAASSAGAVSFQAAATTDISPYAPASAVFADFNSDGNQDLALFISDGSNHHLRIMTGDGSGSLSFSTDLTTPAASGSLVAADLNNDGITDLVASSTAANGVSVFICNGNGTFQGRVDYTVGTAPTAIAVGDFRGDAVRNDIAVVNSAANSVAILLNDGTGALTVQGSGSWPSVPDAISSVAVGDFDGDDIDDIAIARNSVGKVTIFRGNGVGTFAAGADITVGAAPKALVAADFNNDGMRDLAALDSTDATISLVKGNKNAIFSVDSTFNVTNPADNTVNPVDILAVDLNRDGIPDLAVANNANNSLSVLNGAGDATFTPATIAETFSSGAAPSAIAAGDLNGSGNDLLSLSNTGSSYSLLLNSSPAIAGITVTPGNYDFNNFRVGHLPYISTYLTIANGGSAPLTLSAMTITGTNSDDFQILPQYGTCATTTPTIAVGSNCTVELRFLPITEGTKTAGLNIASNAAVSPMITIPLSGTVIPYNSPLTIYLSFIGRGSGTVSFSSGDPYCAANCSRTPTPDSVNLIPSPATDMFFYGWSGCDAISSGSCQANLESDKRISVNFGLFARQVKLYTGWPIYTATAAEVYSAATTGDTIMVSGALLNENIVMNRSVDITLKGGYDGSFTTQGAATIIRSLTLVAGSAIIDNIVLH